MSLPCTLTLLLPGEAPPPGMDDLTAGASTADYDKSTRSSSVGKTHSQVRGGSFDGSAPGAGSSGLSRILR